MDSDNSKTHDPWMTDDAVLSLDLFTRPVHHAVKEPLGNAINEIRRFFSKLPSGYNQVTVFVRTIHGDLTTMETGPEPAEILVLSYLKLICGDEKCM